MTNVFFDLDGTLIDASERLYRLFCDLIPECKFTKREYWELKRNKINHQIMLKEYFKKYNFEDFNEKWLSLIETDIYLNFDKVYDGVYDMLDKLTPKHKLYLLTARQSKENLINELDKFDLQKYFVRILVTENKKTKEDLLKEINISTNDYFVTDMGKDIQTAKKMGIKSIGVTYGFMNKEKILEYSPEYICNSINQLEL